jgi:G3E family GTPase
MHNHTHEHITTRKISLNKPLSRDELLSLIKNEAENAFRVKGLADIDTEGNTVVIQGVNGRVELQKPDREPPKERFIVIIENSESHTSCAAPYH